MANFNLPTVADFRKYGRFYHIQDLDIYHEIPNEIIFFVFPHIFFVKHRINKKFIENLRNFCINLKKQADHEDYIQELKDRKELLIRRLEDKLRNKLLNCNNDETIYDYNE